MIIFVPSHVAFRHVTRSNPIRALAEHTFVMSASEGIVVTLHALSMEKMWLTGALTEHNAGNHGLRFLIQDNR